jgi:hypothetical protein
MVLTCLRCGYLLAYPGADLPPLRSVPPICPGCRLWTKWETNPPADVQAAWILSWNDRQFLHALCIGTD